VVGMGQVGWGMVAVHGGNCIHGVLWAFFFVFSIHFRAGGSPFDEPLE